MLHNRFIIFPSEKGAEREKRRQFAASKSDVFLGENIFSLQHFLKLLVPPLKPLLKRNTQKHLLLYCLRNFPLRYFEKLRHNPALTSPFLSAIRQLKRYNISPDDLRDRLQQTGTLKENDLLTLYERYEELKEKLSLLDDEDQYSAAIQNLNNPHHPLQNIVTLSFQNFSEKTPTLHRLLTALSKTFPRLKIEFELLPSVSPDSLAPVQLLTFSSPHQEAEWFLQQKKSAEGSAILTGQNDLYNESIWQKLLNAGWVEGISPFLSWRERPEGRRLLESAARQDDGKKNLGDWIASLHERMNSDDPLYDWLPSFYFSEHLLSLGFLSHAEWMLWLAEALEEKPSPVPDARASIQWLSLGGGDTPEMESLWVPGLVEGQLPAMVPPTFFQDMKDRSRPEWQPIVEAFPDLQTQFEKQRDVFLNGLSRIKKEIYLTYPKMNSLGKDLFVSPLAWDFGAATGTQVMPSLEAGTLELEQKLEIEQERWSNHLVTPIYHADFRNEMEPIPLLVQKSDHIFSPSRLERYAECPFKYFAGRVLNIPEVREYSPEVDPSDRGNLFHECLETLLTEHGALFAEAKEDPLKENEFFAKLSQIVEDVFAKMRDEIAYANPQLYDHLKQKTLLQATHVLQKELEEARALESPLTPTRFEWAFGKEESPPLNIAQDNGEPVLLGGRIDRIDTDPKLKRFMVLDYKTGTTDGFLKKLLEGLSLQLPIYILAVRTLLLTGYQPAGGMLVTVKEAKKIHGMVDADFNKTHFSFRKNANALMEHDVFEKTIAETMEQVRSYVASIRAGYFSAQPKDCKPYCDYKEICRYAHKPKD
ncbi:MAG: PD-(D/E)XK nuclease family protein [Deltaproteobacteria bacterium]|nr:PD-(D/E)XK nuclease family protein [Deltaproteobacteria bacterium]